MIRVLLPCIGLVALFENAVAESPRLRTQLVLSTYRLEHPKTSGSGFILRRPDPAGNESEQLLLVTAAHAFEKMDGNRVTLVLRKRKSSGGWEAAPIEIEIRQDEKPNWHRHPKQDVAVMRLEPPDNTVVDSVPVATLATAEQWVKFAPEPGALVRCVGFPHAAQFKPSEAGFPLTRLGCIASYPLSPPSEHAIFLVDYNSFEGDSGGPVYREELDGTVKIVGLVHGQHFLDERYKLVYQEGMIRKRLGLAIIVNSTAILETIELLP